MKVLHLINTLSAGGAELHLLTLCRHLKANNVKPVVACLREHVKGSRSLREDFVRAGVRVIDLDADSRYDSRFFAGLARALNAEQPDVLHTHLPRADVAGAFAHLLRPSLAWVCSVHAIYSADWSGRWSLPLVRVLWRRANRVLCISYAVRDWMVGKGMPADKLKVIHYGIESRPFARPHIDLRAKWQLRGHRIIGSLGRLEPRKGHQYLIEAMPELCRKIPDARLLIAGHDPEDYGKALQKLAGKLNVADKVHLLGFQEDVASFLHAIDVFAFATTSEGFGQVLVEAMAAGKPVVASNLAPLTEIAEDKNTALLVDPANPAAFAGALAQVLDDSIDRQGMGQRARQRVEKFFTAEKMAAATLSLYQEARGEVANLRRFA
ncbi:MAG TPA: glycosyltransferase family 4 protein [Candidatus Binatus sp.]|nr:glycosyltransferase family 4 protein [Candidatus Binatus sp.]